MGPITALAAIAKLEAAMQRGVMEVEIDGVRTRYQSIPDMLRAISYFRAVADAATPAAGQSFAVFERG